MTITSESLARHFASLPDEELVEKFQSGELTDLAQDLAAAELRARRIDVPRRKPTVANPALPEEEEANVIPMVIGGDLVQLASFSDLNSANLLQSRLDAEGVPAIVPDTFASLADGHFLVRVMVPESYFERAAQIKMRIDRGDYELDEKDAN